MDNLKENKKIIIICLVIVGFSIGIYFIYDNKEYFGDYVEYKDYDIDRYEANTYIPVYITEKDMANKYLNDYKNIILTDINKAYDILNNDYSVRKFDNFDNFSKYVDSIKIPSFYKLSVKEYSVFNKNGYKFYYIVASNNELYIFKEKSIMDYEVYLDDYTVELK